MNTLTHNQAGRNAVAGSSRDRGGIIGYPFATWSATAALGCISIDTMTHADHKSTRPRPLEPSQ